MLRTPISRYPLHCPAVRMHAGGLPHPAARMPTVARLVAIRPHCYHAILLRTRFDLNLRMCICVLMFACCMFEITAQDLESSGHTHPPYQMTR